MPQGEQVLIEFGTAAILIVITIAVQTLASIALLYWALGVFREAERRFNLLWRMSVVIRIILAFITLHLVQMIVWALAYLLLGAFATLEEALYFSLGTFSTSDVGNSALPDAWRLLGPFEGLSGIIAFGLSIGFIYTVINRLNETRVRRVQESQDKAAE